MAIRILYHADPSRFTEESGPSRSDCWTGHPGTSLRNIGSSTWTLPGIARPGSPTITNSGEDHLSMILHERSYFGGEELMPGHLGESFPTHGELEGSVALVTGGASGIGLATAALFAHHGAHVVIGDRHTQRAEVACAQLLAEGLTAYAVPLDVAEDTDWLRAVGEIEDLTGGIDVLVNNAGINTNQGIMTATIDDWDRTIEVNLRGVFLGLRHVAPVMQERGGGTIVNVTSFASLIGYHSAAYSASKWAVRGLTKSAAAEFASWNIRVNSLHPGSVPTEMHRVTPPGHGDAWRRLTPLERLGSPEELAEAALFLASSRSSYVTGSDLVVDGGLSSSGISRARAHLLDTWHSAPADEANSR